jgi:hypothetical protein
LSAKTLSLFQRGYDTYAISLMLEVNEWTIERALHAAKPEPKERHA